MLASVAMISGLLGLGSAHEDAVHSAYRLNVGGSDYLDDLGHLWTSDASFNSGNPYSTTSAISGTSNPTLYQTERWVSQGNLFQYSLPVTGTESGVDGASGPGLYEVRFHFADIFSLTNQVGARVFDVIAEGQVLFKDLDIYSEVGGFAALIKTARVNVSDGILDLELVHGIENPKLSALEVDFILPPQPPVADIQILSRSDTSIPTTLPVTVSFSGQGSSDPEGEMLIYSWDFGDGLGASDLEAPTYQYQSEGGFLVKLTVTDPGGLSNSNVYPLVISLVNQAPVVITKASPITGDQSLLVRFQGDDSYSPGSGNLTYLWDFGDGSVSSILPNPTHVYHQVGIYQATLTVTDSNGLSSSETIAITVNVVHDRGVPLYRLNVGGPDYLDSRGQLWSSDTLFNSGNIFGVSYDISDTIEPELYQTERWWSPYGEPEYQLPVDIEPKLYQVQLHFADIFTGTHVVGGRVFDVLLEDTVIFEDLDIFSEVGGWKVLIKTATVLVEDGTLNLRFQHGIENPKLSALEVFPYQSNGLNLHVVILAPKIVVDYDQDGTELVLLDGTDSHTHEPGRVLNSFEWFTEGTIFATGALTTVPLSVGTHTLNLKIYDDNSPPDYLTDLVTLEVRAPDNVPGDLMLYYQDSRLLDLFTNPGLSLFSENRLAVNLQGSGDIGTILPVFGEVKDNLVLEEIGTTPLTQKTLVRWLFQVDFPTIEIYQFEVTGGQRQSVALLDQVTNTLNEITGPQMFMVGREQFEVRFLVDTQLPNQFPLEIKITNSQGTTLSPDSITHNQQSLVPIINTAPPSGSTLGGEEITLTGLGFFPVQNVSVLWGSLTIGSPDLSVTPDSIKLTVPPGTGTVSVTVETVNSINGESSIRSSLPISYTYLEDVVPILFTKTKLMDLGAPTSVEWGPDGRLYLAAIDGKVHIVSLTEDYQVTSVQTSELIASLPNSAIMGLTFNPFDSNPNNPKIYVSHGTLYANGGGCFTGTSTYSGQVSILSGPNYETLTPLITGLPVSNHDHLVNGMQFDNNGDLLIAVGGNTNAGVEACAIGGIPESPLSAAIIKAHLSEPDFNGAIVYRERIAMGNVNNDQVFGGIVDLDPSVNRYFSVFASGLRNPWDLVWTTKEEVFVTDNGPNIGFGGSSTSANTQDADPYGSDELLLLKKGQYAGHPNRNRGFYDHRENVYQGQFTTTKDEPESGEIFTQAWSNFAPSTNGIVEYRAATFNSAMRGALLLQKWNDETYRVTLKSDRSGVAEVTTLPISLNSLDVTTGPGGVLFGSDLSGNAIWIAKPNLANTSSLALYDVFPWRAPTSGGQPFILGGTGFSGGLEVSFGTTLATITKVTSTRIEGIIPPSDPTPNQLIDLTVTLGNVSTTLTGAFLYLSPPTIRPSDGRWISGPNLPTALGEVTGGLINGKLYLVGEGSSATFSYDTAEGTWSSGVPLPVRPFLGDHHVAEVYQGKWYLFGGSGSSAGKVQIFNPVTNLWSLGQSMPWAGISASSALIGKKIYLAGGIVLGNTVTNLASYDPETDTWTELTPMPYGRNHAASGTDGSRFFIFGGRGPGSGDGNVVADGFATTQIYDPTTDSWITSDLIVPNDMTFPTPLPLPEGRGGMGKAVYFKGEFYLFGGETLTSPQANLFGVYDLVDVYDPVKNLWRSETRMNYARHGLYPVLVGERIFLTGGGTQAGYSNSGIFEIFVP